MSKGFRFWTRATLVGTLAVLMTFNPAWAGKGLRGWLKKRAAAKCCEPVITCCPPVADCCEVSCEPIAECDAPTCCGSVPVECCETPECGSITDSGISEHQPTESDWNMPVVPAPSQAGNDSADSTTQTPPPSNTFEPPAPTETPETPARSIVEGSTAEVGSPSDGVPSSNDVFGETPAEPEPAPEQPSTTGGDLFDTPAEPAIEAAPMKVEPTEPATDLFSEPATGASAGDLFDTPAETVPMETQPAQPATDLFGEPATDAPATDLFDSPAASTAPENVPSNDLFDTEPATAAGSTPAVEPPMTEQPAAAADELFGTPSNATVPGDDLFNTPATDSTPAQPERNSEPMDDLFGPPSDPTVPGEQKAPPADTDDLFGNFSLPTSDGEKEATSSEAMDTQQTLEAESKPVEETNSNDQFDDLFGARAVRNWKDNTGNFEVEAVLAEIHTDKVRLLKSNGKFCSVPMNRLSTQDREFVERVASKLPAGQVKYVAAR